MPANETGLRIESVDDMITRTVQFKIYKEDHTVDDDWKSLLEE